MNKKKTVRKIKPQIKFAIIVLAILFFIWILWINFSQFIIKKNMNIQKTQVQLKYEKDWKNASGEDKALYLGKLFASDFFTWRNKPRKGNIGGISYVSPEIIDGFREEVYSNYYEYFTEIRDEVGNNALPQVKNIQVVALRNVDILPLTSRVLFNENKSPKNIMALDVKIVYDENTKNEQRYHHEATIYMSKNTKGEYSVVKLVSK